MTEFDGFYRRHLPHWQPPGATLFLTWRLHGSLPREALERVAEERWQLDRLPARPEETARDRATRHDKRLLALFDELLSQSRSAPHFLGDERIARLVTDALFFHTGRLYSLEAFVVMPNHVHVLLTPLPIEQGRREAGQASNSDLYVPLTKITQSLKGYTAREANRLLSRTGSPFWQDESYDHCARSEDEAQRIADYIESDPVRSMLTATPEEWRWSSAWERVWGRGEQGGRS